MRHIPLPVAVGFIDHQQNGRVGNSFFHFLRFTQYFGDFFVGRCDAADRIHQEKNRVRFSHGDHCLRANLLDKVCRSH